MLSEVEILYRCFSRLAEVQKRDNERLQRSMLEWSSVEKDLLVKWCDEYSNKNARVKQQISVQWIFEVCKICITSRADAWVSCETISMFSFGRSLNMEISEHYRAVDVGVWWTFFMSSILASKHLWNPDKILAYNWSRALNTDTQIKWWKPLLHKNDFNAKSVFG